MVFLIFFFSKPGLTVEFRLSSNSRFFRLVCPHALMLKLQAYTTWPSTDNSYFSLKVSEQFKYSSLNCQDKGAFLIVQISVLISFLFFFFLGIMNDQHMTYSGLRPLELWATGMTRTQESCKENERWRIHYQQFIHNESAYR